MKLISALALSTTMAFAGALYAADAPKAKLTSTPVTDTAGVKGPHGDAKGPGPHGDHLKKVDTNHDGAISKDEFLAEAGERFEKMDANHDGKITQDEMKAHHDAMREKFKEMRGHRGGPDGAPAGEAK